MNRLHAEDPSESVIPAHWAAQLKRLSAAFELTLTEVREDWSAVHDSANANADLHELLRLRHAWDPSMAPYYVKWLKRARRGE